MMKGGGGDAAAAPAGGAAALRSFASLLAAAAAAVTGDGGGGGGGVHDAGNVPGHAASRITRNGREVLRNTTNATTSILSNEASTTAGSLDKKDASKAAIAQRRSARLSKNDSQPNAKADAAVAVAAPQEEPSVLATTQSQAVKKKYDTSILEIAKRRRRERTEAAARARSLQQQEAKRSKLSDPYDHGGAEDATEAAAPVPKTRGRSRQENEEEEKASEYQLRRGRSRSKKPPPSSTLAPTAAAVTVASPVAGDVCYEMVPATVLDPNMYTPGIADYDLASRGNVLEVPEYVTDIYQRLYEAETRTLMRPYMHKQTQITPIMRAILINWIVEAHLKFKLHPETLYLTVNILDRYLSRVRVDRHRLQLVGATALLIASKYEEVYPPEIRDLIDKTGDAYSHREFLDMEDCILNTLGFQFSGPTAYPFLVRFLFLTDATPTMRDAAHYYLERVLQDYDYVAKRPSLVAAAAVCLALNHPQIRQKNHLDEELPGVNDISAEAKSIARSVAYHVTTSAKRTLKAVYDKYSSERYDRVACKFDAPPALPNIESLAE